jgi:hypothetical protein
MSIRRKTLRLLVMVLVAAVSVTSSLPASAQTATPPGTTAPRTTQRGGGGPYVILDKDFWEAMERLSRSQGEVYGDRQEPLLEKIALTSQYMVQTNLTIIKQNERIIQLLEELNRNAIAQPRNVKP